MTTIHGHIRSSESKEPIPGLVVKVLSSTTKVPAKITDPFSVYKQSLDAAITDKQGQFCLKFEYKLAKGVKKLPSMILAVFAPVAVEAGTRPIAKSWQDRLLHWMQLVELLEADREELVIWIPKERLRKFQIELLSDQVRFSVDTLVSRLVSATQDKSRFRIALREQLAPMRREHIKRQRQISSNAKRLTANLHMTPKAQRSKTFVSRGGNINDAVVNAIHGGISHISKARGKCYIDIWRAEEEIASALNLEPATPPPPEVYLSQEQLCRLLRGRHNGAELVFVHDLLESRRHAQEGGENGLEKDSEDEETTPETVEPSEIIRRHVLGQLADLPLGAPTAKNAKPLTLEQLNINLPQFSLGAGPTEVAAIHDFYHLQIAFEHVWTEAFDEELRSQVEDLYSAAVQLHEDYLEEEFETPTEIAEIEDLKDFLRELSVLSDWMVDPIPVPVRTYFADVTIQIWSMLSEDQRAQLTDIATELAEVWNRWYREADAVRKGEIWITEVTPLINTGHMIYEGVDAENTDVPYNRIIRLLTEIKKRLSEPYSFRYFAKDKANFGLLLTYRQIWEPGCYQVGDLVSTIPLAPGEKRKFSTKKVVKQSRSETELEKSLAVKSQEVSGTRRAESEIVSRASLRSNFEMNAEGTFRFGIGEITTGTRYALDQSQESSRVKKDFREAVIKAAQEYKQEHSIKVETTSDVTMETTSSGEIGNPNNELTVTYLLYELERQYTISERIHRVTPVVLVAQDIPAPNEITESWLLAHDWILRRVILDDTLLPALDYLSDAFAGDEISINVKKANWEKQLSMVQDLEATVKGYRSAREEIREVLIKADEDVRRAEAREDDDSVRRVFRAIFTGGLSELAPRPGEVSPEQAAVLRKTLEDRLNYLEETLTETQERLVQAHQGLNQATRAYTQVLQAQTNRRVAIDQLRVHVKDNILYYMQAIWDHEPPDQRFFRLADVEVALPEVSERVCRLRRATDADIDAGIPILERSGERYIIEDCAPPEPPEDYESAPKKKLVEIADLDRPLGYKGNYIIFPLKTCLYLTDFMMREFYDDYFGVHDPDLAGNFTTEELVRYTEELLSDETVTLTEEQRAALQRMVLQRLQQPRRDKDLVVVPTGELYMEALMGNYPLLENFKLMHRGMDVAKVRAELRETELDNLRRAARLLQTEPNLDDPDVDKHIVVEGISDAHVDT